MAGIVSHCINDNNSQHGSNPEASLDHTINMPIKEPSTIHILSLAYFVSTVRTVFLL